MNLLESAWLPVRRQSGRRELITPWQLTEGHECDPIIAFASPRADFDGALMQFLIGLAQTAAAPADQDAWIESYENPPDSATLRQRMGAYADAFELFGDGPRFLQDLTLAEGEEKEAGALFIEAPGGNTLKNNLDHFIKRGGLNALCPGCAASALFCLQTNAPSGGVGHRTSLRGGGPLTTLVVADPRAEEVGLVATLWRNVWLNVLEQDVLLRQSGNPERRTPAHIFPWLAPTRTSEARTGHATTPDDAHPLQMYWGMPRRIRLMDEALEGICDVCGATTQAQVRHYLTRNYGMNYEGPWRHPLSPHTVDKRGQPLPVHPQPGGLPYRHWLGLVQAADTKPLRREPAQVVQTFWQQRVREVPGQFRVWAFGYDMDNMKARCWYESTIPLYRLSPELLPEFEDNIGKLVFAAGEVANNLQNAIKKAWFRRPQDAKGDTSFVKAAFWEATEAAFYAALAELQRCLPDREASLAARKRWLQGLARKAEALFDQWALSGPIEDSDPRRISRARHDLNAFNRSAPLLTALGLPTPKHRKGAAAALQGETV